jgi:very-short-patch-repair endonuclease
MQNQSTSNAQENARTLRREMTDSERKLCSGLRSEQLGVKFRRQHPLGNYIADFVCRRGAFLRGQGFDVLRFGSHDPFINPEGVLQAIVNRRDELSAACPHPSLPPEGEGAIPRSHS